MCAGLNASWLFQSIVMSYASLSNSNYVCSINLAHGLPMLHFLSILPSGTLFDVSLQLRIWPCHENPRFCIALQCLLCYVILSRLFSFVNISIQLVLLIFWATSRNPYNHVGNIWVTQTFTDNIYSVTSTFTQAISMR